MRVREGRDNKIKGLRFEVQGKLLSEAGRVTEDGCVLEGNALKEKCWNKKRCERAGGKGRSIS